jgi:UDP-N-acetylmuramate dehydrogenase
MIQRLIKKRDFPLNTISTFGIGGPADLLIEVHTAEDMQAAVAFCKSHQRRYIIVGKGSNVLFSDQGFCGVVIWNKVDFLTDLGHGTFQAGAGYSFSRLGTLTAKQGWSGLEFAAGIPASVGGAVYMNAGAHGAETSTHLTCVEYIDSCGKLQNVDRQSLNFSYRCSPFQSDTGCAIISATFKLSPSTSARAHQQALIAGRTKSQPLKDKSAGCVFRNPPQESAGALIDRCHLKGTSIGHAQISPRHANFITNQGGAKAADVLALISLVQEQVQLTTGIQLETEIQIIPYK